MKRMMSFCLPLAMVVAVALPAAGQDAADAGFKKGDRVTIGYSGEPGTVVSSTGPNSNGGYYVKVHLDRLGPAYPEVGPTYDTSVVQLNR